MPKEKKAEEYFDEWFDKMPPGDQKATMTACEVICAFEIIRAKKVTDTDLPILECNVCPETPKKLVRNSDANNSTCGSYLKLYRLRPANNGKSLGIWEGNYRIVEDKLRWAPAPKYSEPGKLYTALKDLFIKGRIHNSQLHPGGVAHILQ